jgi:acetolactate synthase-1/2/3 large subunit
MAADTRLPAGARSLAGDVHENKSERVMDKVTGGHVLVKALKSHGIKRIFSLPGAPLFPVYEACLNEGVEVIVGRHEASLVHMAEGWSRATGEPSVVLVSPGPGHANAMAGIAIAYAECSPVIVLSGIDMMARLGKGARQELPQVEMCIPITKWSALLSDIKRIPEYIARAFRTATSGMPGPHQLDRGFNVGNGRSRRSFHSPGQYDQADGRRRGGRPVHRANPGTVG